MKCGVLKRLYTWFVRGVQLQLYLTLMSAPILVYWGLPISLASPLGNLLFHPLLTLFLFLSSLVFFCHVFHMPHGAFTYGLEKTSTLFHVLLGYGRGGWLVGLPQPPTYLLVLLPLVTACVFCCKKTRSLYRSIGCLLILSCSFGLILKYAHMAPPMIDLACNRGTLHIICSEGNVVIIDTGVLGQRLSVRSWIEYTLAPAIIHATGLTTISSIIVMQPSQTTFDAIAALCGACCVQTVCMPLWRGTMSAGQRRSYAQLMAAFDEGGTKFVRIRDTMAFDIGCCHMVILELEGRVKSKDMDYKALRVEASMGDRTIAYSSYKHEKKIAHRTRGVRTIHKGAGTSDDGNGAVEPTVDAS